MIYHPDVYRELLLIINRNFLTFPEVCKVLWAPLAPIRSPPLERPSSPIMSSGPTYTRVALVTGGAQGIGRAIALRLAADGLDVAVDDIPSETHRLEEVVTEIKRMGRKAVALMCDVSKEDEVKTMVEQTVAELGRLDAVHIDIISGLWQ
jgi:short chain dehydrogenase